MTGTRVDGQAKPRRIPVISLLDLNEVHKQRRRRMLSLATDRMIPSTRYPQPAATHLHFELGRRRDACL